MWLVGRDLHFKRHLLPNLTTLDSVYTTATPECRRVTMIAKNIRIMCKKLVQPTCPKSTQPSLIPLQAFWRANCQCNSVRMLIPFVFGGHERMKDLERRVGSIARSGLPVLIEGATGTG